MRVCMHVCGWVGGCVCVGGWVGVCVCVCVCENMGVGVSGLAQEYNIIVWYGAL